jgi:DNA-binding NarL/FixJ family response regulator
MPAAITPPPYTRSAFQGAVPGCTHCRLAERYELSDMISACRAGVHGYFAKVSTSDAFVKSLELIMLGETILPVVVLDCLLDKEDPAPSKPLKTALTNCHGPKALTSRACHLRKIPSSNA